MLKLKGILTQYVSIKRISLKEKDILGKWDVLVWLSATC